MVGNLVYVARGTNGLSIFNAANPAAMTSVKNVTGIGNVANLEIQGNYAYVACNSVGLKIIDISVPAQAAVVGTYSAVTAVRSVAIKDGYAYVSDSTNDGAGGLLVLDVTNPTAPAYVSRLDTGAGTIDVRLVGSYALLGEYKNKLIVAGISDPAHPQVVADLAITSSGFQTVVEGGLIYLANSTSGIRIFQAE